MRSEPLVIVADNNVVVSSSLAPGSAAAQVLSLAIERHLLITTQPILTELESVIRRSKFERYLPLERRLQFAERYSNRCDILNVTVAVSECRDPKDDKFLSLALQAQADLIISGDKDLLVLHPWQGIPILNPKDALEHLTRLAFHPPPA